MYPLLAVPARIKRVSGRRCLSNLSRKWWIAHGLNTAGTVVVDEGAYRAVGRRESGGRLLPAGVVRVEGPFASHQAVRIVVRRKRRFPPAPLITEPVSEAPTPARINIPNQPIDVDRLASPAKGKHPLAQTRVVVSIESSPDTAPEPGTPLIQPALSLSSSVASLDPLSRTVPNSPAMRAVAEQPTMSSITAELSSATMEDDEWEEIEVGKGLAQYNSVEIDRIKGMKR